MGKGLVHVVRNQKKKQKVPVSAGVHFDLNYFEILLKFVEYEQKRVQMDKYRIPMTLHTAFAKKFVRGF